MKAYLHELWACTVGVVMAPTVLLMTMKTWAGQTDPVIEAVKEAYREEIGQEKVLAAWAAEITFYLLVAILVMAGDNAEAPASLIYYFLACLIFFGMVIEVMWRVTVSKTDSQ